MISDLFRQMEELLEPAGGPPMDGWCTRERAADLMSLVIGLRPEISVEIGVWGGRATIPMALAHRAIGRGHVVAIDPWSAEASAVGQTGENRAWWDDQSKHSLVYDRFMAKVRELQLEDFIEVRRQTSDQFDPPEGLGLVCCDGNHSDQAIRDVERYAAQVKRGGIFYADDLNWAGGGVRKSIDVLVSLGFEEIHRRDEGAFFQRVK